MREDKIIKFRNEVIPKAHEPLKNYKVTSRYGVARSYYTTKGEYKTDVHNGVDLYSDDREVYAMFDGGVMEVFPDDGTGAKTVIMKHGEILPFGDILLTLVTHLDEIKVKRGDFIKAGDIVGIEGSSGNVTGRHLHLSMYRIPKYIWHHNKEWFTWDYKERYKYEINPNEVYRFYDEV